MKKSAKKPEDLNKEYFQALGSTRASVGMLKLSWASVSVALINLYAPYTILTTINRVNPLSSPFYLFLLVIVFFNFLCFIFSFLNKVIFRHQGIFTALLFGMIISLFLSLIIGCSGLLIYYDKNPRLDDIKTLVIVGMVLLLIGFAIIYNIFWLKKQLNMGFSEERTNANYFAASSVFSSGSLWIIFAFTILGGGAAAILTKSWNGILGVLGNILFISAFSRLIVEVGYLTYLRIKDKSYWEEMPEELADQSLLKVLDARKTKPRLIIEVVLFLSLMSYIQVMKIDVANSPMWLTWTIRIFAYAIMLDVAVSFIIHRIRKRK